MFFFFFSSRRRHTRFDCDWSSDVCSSDCPFQDPTSQYSGVLAKFCTKMLRGEEPTIYGDGEQSRDFTFVDNVVEGNILAATAPASEAAGKMMNLATAQRYTLNQTVEILRKLTGYKGEVTY